MSDLATCRICGCTEDRACEGGCFWVEDPENLGDLCSNCLPRLAAPAPDLAANADNHVWEIPLDQMRPAPWNPPSRVNPAKVTELADSIRIEGQQSPALIRPVEAEPPVAYEIVWGHRRYAALQLLAAQTFSYKPAMDGKVTLKAFIREMDEQAAMISSGIENLQREGFSDIEEAEFFRTCGEKYGASAVKTLSEKLSVSDRYIRKRIRMLELPAKALDHWRSGTWHVGHMEQLLRLGEPGKVADFLEKIDPRQKLKLAVWELKDMIDRLAIPLHSGNFDKADCKVCGKNSDRQHKLFGGDKEKASCLDTGCFQEKQQAWYDLNWAGAKHNKHRTQAAVITDTYNFKITGEFSKWSYKPGQGCLDCQYFSTLFLLRRSLDTYQEMVCLGPSDCYSKITKAAQKNNKAAKINAANSDPEAPRVAWHGEFFRQEFYQQEIPRLMAELGVDDPRRLQVALAMLVHSSRDSHEWFWQKLGLEVPTFKNNWEHFHPSFYQILQAVKCKNSLQTELLLAEVLVKIALQRGRSYKTTLADRDRQALAEFLDIDWTRFQVTGDYLEKKTKSEIIRFIVHDSGLWQTPEFKDGMLKPGFSTALTPEQLAAAKKPRLVELILQCGVDLHGRLPKEIADRPKLDQENRE